MDRGIELGSGRAALRARLLLLLLVFLSGGLVVPLSTAAAADAQEGRADPPLPVLRGGWFLWDPYQFTVARDGAQVLTGLDVELTRAIAAEAGFAVDIVYRPWHDHQAELRGGEADIAAGATWTEARAAYAHFSIPYRQETNALYLPRGTADRYPFEDAAGMMRAFATSGFRLGAINGFAYADPAVNAYIADPAHTDRVLLVDSDYQNFRNLLEGRIDGFLADRLVATTSAWRSGWRDQVEEHPLRLTDDIHFMFSKATITPDVVARFDAAITMLDERGETRRIVSEYIFPILLAQTLDSDWFRFFDIAGTIAFALSGVLIAYRERFSLLGALVLAALPAVGGGAMRDLVVGRTPLAVLSTPLYMALVGGTVLIGFLTIRILRAAQAHALLPETMKGLPRQRVVRDLYAVSDAVGIAAFTVTGVAVAVSATTDPLWLWGPILAMLTAAGGGILRDTVRQSGSIASLKGDFYAEVPLLWGLFLSLYLAWRSPRLDPDQFVAAVLLTMIGAFLTRMAAVLLGWRSPAFA